MGTNFLSCCLLLLFVGVANAQSLLDQVKSNDFLLDGNLAILVSDGKEYLVSVGTAEVNSNTPSLIKRSRIKAKVRAQTQLAKFIHDVQIEVTETLENQVQVIEENEKSVSLHQKNNYLEQIREINEGALKNITTLGIWTDNQTYFYALSLPVE